MNVITEKRILTIIAQSYAIKLEELEVMYASLMSFDKMINIVEIANRSGLSLERAKEVARI